MRKHIATKELLSRLMSDNSMTHIDRLRELSLFRESLLHTRIASVGTVSFFVAGAISAHFNQQILMGICFGLGTGVGGFAYLAERAHVETVNFLREKYDTQSGPEIK